MLINNIINTLNKDGIICFPTETVYALACNATSIPAIKKIYNIKNRPFSKPLSIFIQNTNSISNFAQITSQQFNLINQFSPGPITFILNLKKNSILPKDFFHENIGIRIPSHPLALFILQTIKYPIIATSVNISGKQSIVSADNIPNHIVNNIDFIIKNDKLSLRRESTIVDLTRNKIKIIREGVIPSNIILQKYENR